MDFEEIAPNFKKALMNKMEEHSFYWALLGLKLIDIKKGWAKVKLPFHKKITQPFGIVHGGAIFSLADSAAAMAMLGLVEKNSIFTTVESKINYIQPFSEGEIVAEALIYSKRKRLALCDVEIRNDKKEYIARGTVTIMITS